MFIVNQPSLDSLRRLRARPGHARAGCNPRLVYCAVSGFGMTGPAAGEAGYDIIAQGRAGLMTLTGEPGSGPIRYPIPLADATCGMYAAMGILAALLARESTGRGQFLDVSLLDSQLAWLTHVAGAYFATGERPKKLRQRARDDRALPALPRIGQVRDGRGRARIACGSASARLWRSQTRSGRTPASRSIPTGCGTAIS